MSQKRKNYVSQQLLHSIIIIIITITLSHIRTHADTLFLILSYKQRIKTPTPIKTEKRKKTFSKKMLRALDVILFSKQKRIKHVHNPFCREVWHVLDVNFHCLYGIIYTSTMYVYTLHCFSSFSFPTPSLSLSSFFFSL